LFNFKENTLTLGAKEAPIESFRVEFATPWGVCSTLKEALEKCEGLDMDVTLMIQPVVVIYDQAGRSEIIMRGK
jgi:hypothetical protein